MPQYIVKCTGMTEQLKVPVGGEQTKVVMNSVRLEEIEVGEDRTGNIFTVITSDSYFELGKEYKLTVEEDLKREDERQAKRDPEDKKVERERIREDELIEQDRAKEDSKVKE